MQEYILENYNGAKRKRKAEWHTCKQCGKLFLRRIVVTKGREKAEYCSTFCRGKSKINRVEVVCFCCGKKFGRVQSKILNSRHGYSFCSRKCKEIAQSCDGNCDEIKPLHYGDGRTVYARRAFRNFKNECVQCGENKDYLLVVHHIDGDKDNGELTNLEIVCFNCHAERHLYKNDGVLIFSTKALTDRNDLSSL